MTNEFPNTRHGMLQLRNPWSDGPEYITQCPIKPGANFTQHILLTEEEGTFWWHAHSDFDLATVHGPLIIYPKNGTVYPFSKPRKEFTLILGEWWNKDVNTMLEEALQSGGEVQPSDANTINGQPGDFLPCSQNGISFSLLCSEVCVIITIKNKVIEKNSAIRKLNKETKWATSRKHRANNVMDMWSLK